MVSKCFSKFQGVDYHETFAPVEKMDSIRLVLAIAPSKHWEVHHMDVKSFFLHGDLQDDIYMKHPEVYTLDPSLVCKLQKSLYGLKQAPRSWYAKMDAFLLSQNFEKCKSDPNVYLQQYEGNIMIILLYVDDILITGRTLALIAFIKTTLHDAFEMRSLCLLRQFLEIEIS